MGWGEREGSQQISSRARPGNFLDFLRTFRKFPGNSVIVPSLDRKRFPPWAYAKFPFRVWENCSGHCKGLFQAQKRKITMTSKENISFCHSVIYVNCICLYFCVKTSKSEKKHVLISSVLQHFSFIH
jgi:hypothetical protein